MALFVGFSMYFAQAQPMRIGLFPNQKFTKIKALNNRLEALKLVLKTSTNKELKQNSIIYTNLVDSIFEVHQKAKNKYARIKYDSKKEKNENFCVFDHFSRKVVFFFPYLFSNGS